ncbi:inorganic phosphate transporter [Conchiformibius kuhniae]|uniref:Phosphate transporter n=1 Tax=Conchiformibius kuhniae TaxID=211502 RepID=A0ABD8B7F3_9NEIS|nr:inorganic phosphate transporter [Conchiformibius kuhniae]
MLPDSPAASMRKINTAFALMLVGMVGYFVYWGLDYTQYNHTMLFLLATLFGVFMAFNIGGNDVANSFGTSVGAGTLTVPQALIVAAVFEVSGAVLAGGEVTATIRSGIVNLNALPMQPLDLVFIMMSALLAAALWLLFATYKGLPVSTTHSIIGGIVGSSLALGVLLSGNGGSATDLVKWNKIGAIVSSWVLSPVLGGAVSYFLFSLVKKNILDYNDDMEKKIATIKAKKKEYKDRYKNDFEKLDPDVKARETAAMVRDAEIYDKADCDPNELESEYYRGLYPHDRAKASLPIYKALRSWVPWISCVAGMMITSMLLFKGLSNLKLGMSMLTNTLIILMVGAFIWLATFIYAKTLKRRDITKSTLLMFSWMQVFTAAGFAFSHGANDIANAIGPFAAIMDVLRTGDIGATASIPPVAMLTFGVALVVGLWFIGKEVIQTVGKGLAELHPSSGFTAELAAATVVMAASVMGLPVSSTHILVGAVLGIGLVNGNANWRMMKPIGLAWVVTLPAASLLSVAVFFVLRGIFG